MTTLLVVSWLGWTRPFPGRFFSAEMAMEMEMVHTRMTTSCSVGAVPLIDAIYGTTC